MLLRGTLSLADQPDEPVRVNLIRVDLDEVSGAPGDNQRLRQARCSQGTAQLGDS
jgi:hypothetical protein